MPHSVLTESGWGSLLLRRCPGQAFMIRQRNQHTIATACEVSGRGYWTARPVRVVMRPAPVGTGIVLVRSDLPDDPSCPALVSYREAARLRTNLVRGKARFQMVEHVLAALYALEIDNCIVEVDSEEFPGLDGSSGAYVSALCEAGIVIQAACKDQFILQQVITLREGDCWLMAAPTTGSVTKFGYQLVFDSAGEIPNQSFTTECTPERFRHEVGSARTFVTERQAMDLQNRGVATHVQYNELLVFGEDGPIGNELRYSNECARHKTLDLIGDLSLAGVELIGKFTSYRGSHHLNGRMAQAIHELATQTKRHQFGEAIKRKAA
ncbi:MAG: UDP-3-O-acyl-N-acetylglucosamine deacetylase [Planctomycetota bacterium]